jgi:hypothetical protein
MTDPLRDAIIAEMERQAKAMGAWYQPPHDDLWPPRDDGSTDVPMQYDGRIDVGALCRVIRSTLGIAEPPTFEAQTPNTSETGNA